jgi:hypothetical protein
MEQAGHGETTAKDIRLASARFRLGKATDNSRSMMCPEVAPQQVHSGISSSSIPRHREVSLTDSSYSTDVDVAVQPG